MSTKAHHLVSPIRIGSLSLRNRVVMAPMTRARAGADRLPDARMAYYYQQRASAGLIISEATVVSKQGIGWQNSPGIYSEEQASAWQQVTDAIHKEGGAIFMQLWHCGRASHSAFHEGAPPVAPSAIPINGDGIYTPQGKLPYETPRALETREILKIVEDFTRAALRARKAGFDGVEVHAANGYLIDQFLQSRTNHRTDAYGGPIINRARLLLEIVDQLLTVWEPSRISVRLSPNGVFNDMGSPDYRETCLYVAEQLANRNIGFLHLLDGLAFGFHELGTPVTLAEIRAVFPKKSDNVGVLIGNCGYTLESGEAAIANDDADLIAYGRMYISNPDLVERFQNGWPLSEMADMSVWYSFDEKGYADFPAYQR